MPYYYINNDYYQWDSDSDAYEQVQPPPQVVQEAGQTSAVPQLFAYPEKGQSPRRQATDKAQCGEWASAQSGFKPAATSPPATPSSSAASDSGASGSGSGATGSTAAASAAADNLAAKQQDYLRAESACLKARGYSVD